MKTTHRILLLLFAGILAVLPAQAVTLNIIYNASVSNSIYSPLIQSALNSVSNNFHVLFTNACTVNVTCYWGQAGPFLTNNDLATDARVSVSQFQEADNFSYAQITNALRNARVDADDSNAVASLPATDPVATNNWWLPRAQAKALNLGTNSKSQLYFSSRTDLVGDGSISFADPAVTGKLYTFSPTNRAVAGRYDFIALAEHEISEIMGRSYELNVDSDGRYIPFDLFRFTNNGVRCFNPNATNVYFSVNKGTNNLRPFYENFAQDPSADACDWQTASQPDVFEATGDAGTILPLSPVDLIAMDIIGYHSPAFPASRLTAAHLTNNTFRLSFTNATGLPFSVFASASLTQNMTNWTYLGLPSETSTGQYQFVDGPLVPQSLRFYRVSLP